MGKKNGKSSESPLKVAIIGAGNRGMVYSSYALEEPDRLKVVAVVEPDEYRRKNASDIFKIPESNCCNNIREFIEMNLDVKAVINTTMDRDHIHTSLPLLKAGYDILLEKPICLTKGELYLLYGTALNYNRKVMVCHVLRYAPFYVELKRRILNGEIGEIVNIQTEENVSYHHFAVSFIRGKWSNSETCGSKIIMAKCCHDLDLIAWLKSGVMPGYVCSFGGLKQYKPENAPEGSGKRCLADCGIESSCPYSAKKNYVECGLWDFYVWRSLQSCGNNMTEDIKLESLKNDNQYGRCVWYCNNNVEDHQTVMIEFDDGTTAVHSLNGGVPKPCRTIHITGTKGEIYGVMEDAYLIVRHSDARKGHEYTEDRIEIDQSNGNGHGGGDMRLVSDFIDTINGREPSISCTSLNDSIYGHLIGFAAGEAMSGRKVVKIEKMSDYEGELL